MENKKVQHKNIGPFLAFTEAYFAKHQTKLLFFLNAPVLKYLARFIFRIHSFDCPYETKIEYIGPNRFTIDAGLQFFKKSALLKSDFENPAQPREIRRIAKKLYLKIQNGTLEDKEILLPAKRTDFRTHPKYGKRLYFAFKPIWWAMHYWDEIFADSYAPEYSFGFSTLTAYPDAHTETATVDGRVVQSGAAVDFTTLVAGAGDGARDDFDNENAISILSSSTATKWNHIIRSIFLFDTSIIGSGATINSATFSLYGSGKADGIAITPNINIYTSAPASNAAIVAGDFDSLGSTAQCDTAITYAGYSTSAYNDFLFNATGRGNVSKTSISKFGARNANYDVANSAPTWGFDNQSRLNGWFADSSGTSTDPKLVVDYSTPVAYTKDLTEVVSLVQTQTKTPSKPALETITLVQTQVKVPSKKVNEVITLVEVFTKISTLFRSLVETITLVATNSAAFLYIKSFTETISILDNIRVRRASQYLLETITLVVNQTYTRQYIKSLADTIVLVASIANARSYQRAFTEVITLVDTIKRTTGKVLEESINLVLRWLGLKNGRDISYRDKYESRSGEYRNKYRQF